MVSNDSEPSENEDEEEEGEEYTDPRWNALKDLSNDKQKKK